MNRLTIPPLSLIILLSCTKPATFSAKQRTDQLNSVTDNVFSSYGLKGDGVNDDTEALQKLVNDSSAVFLQAGTYIINRTIDLKANRKIVGEKGTVIKAGREMIGTLLENGRYFFADHADNSVVSNVKFSQSDNAYHLRDWNNACFFLLNCKNFTVEKCFFDFHLSYQSNGMEAVWVSGTLAKSNVIKNNQINSLGIRYAENGADSTLVESNLLNRPYSNAISATGNHGSDGISGCRVANNKIFNAGRMGIEDWGNTEGTIIQGNIVSGCGKDPNQATDGIGISAVGTNTAVLKNTVTESQIYGIEVRGNYGVLVSGNEIAANGGATGIILNYTFPIPSKNLSLARVEKNKISGSEIGLHIFGNYASNASISYNSFSDNSAKSISIESGAMDYLIELRNNHFNFAIPTDQDRFAIFSYTKYDPGKANQIITSIGDTIDFHNSASGGKGVDFGLVIRTDKAKISKLFIQGNNNRNASKIPVNAITALGARPLGVTFNDNRVLGGLVDLRGFISTVLINNNFVQ